VLNRDLADRLIRIEEGRGGHDPRRLMVESCSRPDGVPARVHGAIWRDHLGQERNCAFAFPRQGLDGPMLDGRSRIVEQVHEIERHHGLPGQLQSLWVLNPGGFLPPDPVDAAENVGLLELRARAAELVPAAGIDHD
jgi:hypothetical protein